MTLCAHEMNDQEKPEQIAPIIYQLWIPEHLAAKPQPNSGTALKPSSFNSTNAPDSPVSSTVLPVYEKRDSSCSVATTCDVGLDFQTSDPVALKNLDVNLCLSTASKVESKTFMDDCGNVTTTTLPYGQGFGRTRLGGGYPLEKVWTQAVDSEASEIHRGAVLDDDALAAILEGAREKGCPLASPDRAALADPRLVKALEGDSDKALPLEWIRTQNQSEAVAHRTTSGAFWNPGSKDSEDGSLWGLVSFEIPFVVTSAPLVSDTSTENQIQDGDGGELSSSSPNAKPAPEIGVPGVICPAHAAIAPRFLF
mmetsp:Transcript_416/g.827  ORF Transcript_416/g.827 Transcript_416/m.827 type:complete len:310 (-) Transcript_416:16-945(-)